MRGRWRTVDDGDRGWSFSRVVLSLGCWRSYLQDLGHERRSITTSGRTGLLAFKCLLANHRILCLVYTSWRCATVSKASDLSGVNNATLTGFQSCIVKTTEVGASSSPQRSPSVPRSNETALAQRHDFACYTGTDNHSVHPWCR